MVKKLLLYIIITLFVIGCSHKEEVPHLDTSKTLREEIIEHRTEKIVLSKGFQSTEPMVEATNEGGKLKLIVRAGVMECSGISIDKVTKSGDTITLYISGLFEKDKMQLAIPQASIIIEEPINNNINNLNFKIVSQNYKPIALKYNKNQIIDKIRGEFKIDINTMPQVELIKHGDNIHWNMVFFNLVHKEKDRYPLSNLKVKADALTGEILDYEKNTISTYIDEGYIMDYLPNKLILYKKTHVDNNIQYESLWTYDIESQHRTKIYTTKLNIQNAYFNPEGKYISLIEKDDTKSDIYIIEVSKNIAYKITSPEHFNPKLIKWKNNDELSIANINNTRTTILTYDVNENRLSKEFEMDKIINSFDILENMIIFSEADELAMNKNIYLTMDGINLKEIGEGFNPSFFDDKNIIYLNNNESVNKNKLIIYSIERNSIMNKLDYNIISYNKLNDDTLTFIENSSFTNEYNFIKYDINNRTVISEYRINSPNLFYNSEDEKAYLSLTISGKDKNINNIYCIDLNEVSIAK